MLLGLLVDASVLVLCFATSGGGDSPTLTSTDVTNIDEFVERVLACRNIPGLTLAVVSRDETLLQKGYGYADVAASTRVTADTLFPIASTTKAFTVALLAKLIETKAKGLDWDKPIRDILGDDFRMYDDVLTRMTSLRDLLSHRTGIPGYFVPLLAGLPSDMTRAQLVRKLQYQAPEWPFRTKFQYNNMMYFLAGHVAEVAGNDVWEKLTRDHLFRPLGMTSTTFTSEITSSTKVAASYVYENEKFRKVKDDMLHQVDLAGAAGAIISNARDMAKWLRLHLNGGTLPSGERLINQTLLAEGYNGLMPSPSPMNDRDLTHPTFPATDVHVSYGMAWMTNFYRGYKRVWHSGGISTFKTNVWLYPEMNFGLYASINGPPTAQSSWGLILVLHYISDILLGKPPYLNTSTSCSFPAPWRQARPSHPKPLPTDQPSKPGREFEGTYSHPGFGDITISHNSSTNRLNAHMGRWFSATLHYKRKNNVFYTQFNGDLWYMPDKIPFKFRHSLPGGSLDILEVPMQSPYDSARPEHFVRNNIVHSNKKVNINIQCSSANDRSSILSFLMTSVMVAYTHLHL